MKQLKIGDKVYCIKDKIVSYVNEYGNFEIGKIYQIDATFPHIIGVNGKFFNYRNHISPNYYKFDDYFITMKELRKQKLLKIQK